MGILKDERGVFGYATAYIIAVVFCIIIFGFLAILVSNLASGFMVGMQPIQAMTLANAAQITDANISASMIASVQTTQALEQTNVELFQTLAGFVGILTIVIVGIVYFLLTQRNVEANTGFG